MPLHESVALNRRNFKRKKDPKAASDDSHQDQMRTNRKGYLTPEQLKKIKINRSPKFYYARKCHYWTPYWQLPKYYLERRILSIPSQQTPVEIMLASASKDLVFNSTVAGTLSSSEETPTFALFMHSPLVQHSLVEPCSAKPESERVAKSKKEPQSFPFNSAFFAGAEETGFSVSSVSHSQTHSEISVEPENSVSVATTGAAFQNTMAASTQTSISATYSSPAHLPLHTESEVEIQHWQNESGAKPAVFSFSTASSAPLHSPEVSEVGPVHISPDFLGFALAINSNSTSLPNALIAVSSTTSAVLPSVQHNPEEPAELAISHNVTIPSTGVVVIIPQIPVHALEAQAEELPVAHAIQPAISISQSMVQYAPVQHLSVEHIQTEAEGLHTGSTLHTVKLHPHESSLHIKSAHAQGTSSKSVFVEPPLSLLLGSKTTPKSVLKVAQASAEPVE